MASNPILQLTYLLSGFDAEEIGSARRNVYLADDFGPAPYKKTDPEYYPEVVLSTSTLRYSIGRYFMKRLRQQDFTHFAGEIGCVFNKIQKFSTWQKMK